MRVNNVIEYTCIGLLGASLFLLPWAALEHPLAGEYRVYAVPVPWSTSPVAPPYAFLLVYLAVILVPRAIQRIALSASTLLYTAVFWGWIQRLPQILPEPVLAQPVHRYWQVGIGVGLPIAIAVSLALLVSEVFVVEKKRIN